jgi:hypothetical protein
VNDPRIQCWLLSEYNLDFDKALKTAQVIEMANRDTEQLQGQQGSDTTPTIYVGNVHKMGGMGNPQRRVLKTHVLSVTDAFAVTRLPFVDTKRLFVTCRV